MSLHAEVLKKEQELYNATVSLRLTASQQEFENKVRQSQGILNEIAQSTVDYPPPTLEHVLTACGLLLGPDELINMDVKLEERQMGFNAVRERLRNAPITDAGPVAAHVSHAEMLYQRSGLSVSMEQHGTLLQLFDAYLACTSTQSPDATLRTIDEEMAKCEAMAPRSGGSVIPISPRQPSSPTVNVPNPPPYPISTGDTEWMFQRRETAQQRLSNATIPAEQHVKAALQTVHDLEGYVQLCNRKLDTLAQADAKMQAFANTLTTFEAAMDSADDLRQQQSHIKDICSTDVRQLQSILIGMKEDNINAVNAFATFVEQSDSDLAQNAADQARVWKEIEAAQQRLKSLANDRLKTMELRVSKQYEESKRARQHAEKMAMLERHGIFLQHTLVSCEAGMEYADFMDGLAEALSSGLQSRYERRNALIDRHRNIAEDQHKAAFTALLAAWTKAALQGGARMVQQSADIASCVRDVGQQLEFCIETIDPNDAQRQNGMQKLRAAAVHTKEIFTTVQNEMQTSLQRYKPSHCPPALEKAAADLVSNVAELEPHFDPIAPLDVDNTVAVAQRRAVGGSLGLRSAAFPGDNQSTRPTTPRGTSTQPTTPQRNGDGVWGSGRYFGPNSTASASARPGTVPHTARR